MKFKYHKSYKGFYLLDGSKFKRPYQKLDEEKTLENLANRVEFKQDEIIEIEDKYVAFLQKEKTNEVPQKTSPLVKEKKVSKIDFNKLELNYKIPRILLENLYNVISKDQSFSEEELLSILASIESIILLDGLFFSKVQKIFYYNTEELNLVLNRYNFCNLDVEKLKKDIELNYPSQYISNLPVDYKEYEMIFVFYFIILVELLSILK
ncbi:exonuclease SbcC [Gemella morbillorum]|uniref:exonuclease SbcC n=1 Tax=Gemella morbillorum TaxID=29391 RepID=UPI0028D010F9|nr:exonuclease SbcC [Gemella morbillorum]